MTTYRKKMIEVALPLEAINKAAAREKSIRHGHPSTLHLWWARRPLAACRAVLFASLVDDPDSDPAYRKADGTVDEERASEKRAELFNLIEELVQWENSNNPTVINAARAEIARCVASRKLETGELKKDTVVYEKSGDGNQESGDRRQETGGGKAVAGSHSDSCILTSGSSPAGPKTPRSWGPPDRTIAWDMVTMNARPEAVNAFLAEHAPPVLDPFCGGGSIPLEAQRLGLRAYASDLNPVPVLITKALIEIPPKFAGKPPVNPESRRQGTLVVQASSLQKNEKEASKMPAPQFWHGAEGLAADVRYYGKWMRDEAEKRIGHLYPKVKITKEMTKERPDLVPLVGQELIVIAWLWARTVPSPNPSCAGAHVPLIRSFWLGKKKGNEAWVKPVIDRSTNAITFRVGVGQATPADFDPDEGTVSAQGGRCVITGVPISFDFIRECGQKGQMSARLIGIVAEGSRRRVYLSPTSEHEKTALCAPPLDGPETPLPEQALGFRVQRYGLDHHHKLFSPRQLSALVTFSGLVRDARRMIERDASGSLGSKESASYADAIATYLALSVSRISSYWCSLTSNDTSREKITSVFSRQTMSMLWDYMEGNPFSDTSGNFMYSIEACCGPLAKLPCDVQGTTLNRDAVSLDVPDIMVSTDPPYYDNIGYADLSDFFYVWLRRCLSEVYPTLFSTLLTPKKQELIATPFRHDGDMNKAKEYFERGLEDTFRRIRRYQANGYPVTVYYAFKQTENEDTDTDEASSASTGWETILAGLRAAGFGVVGTWPLRTEMSGRVRGRGSNALASSIVLVCLPQPDDASLATRKEFITTLRRELPQSLRNLQRGSIAPVDLAQAAIGPGMAVFTRYAKVMETDGSAMSVRTALGLINQALDEVLAEQEGEFDADTRWALAWFEQFGMEDGAFGVAETLSKAKNTAINGLVEAGVVKARAGKVRLLKREELGRQESGDRRQESGDKREKSGDRSQKTEWDPATDDRFTVWEATQHLIRRLQNDGEEAAATLLRKLGGTAEIARDLAYRLYTICERKKWADEALAYNGLVIAWPELTKLAVRQPAGPQATQKELF